jgi:putative transposase
LTRNPRQLIGSGGASIPLTALLQAVSWLKYFCYNIGDMLRTLVVSLRPTAEQAQALLTTMEAFNAACNAVSAVAWETREFNNYHLRKLTYGAIREQFGLPAQLAQHAIAKVAHAYKVSKATRAEFRPHGAVTYDCRVFRLRGVSAVSMTLLSGRSKIALSIGGYQAQRLREAELGEVDLCYLPDKRRFRLHFSLKIDPPPPVETEGFLGVDLGINNIAVDSDGTRHAGGKLRRMRKVSRRVRRRLQKLGTRGARRLLVKRRRKEARRATHVNHCISKQIVATAKGTGRGVGVEDLTHIRSRTTVRRADRAEHSGWAFHQLRFFLGYKCADTGIACVAVDPRNTSRTCPRCGCVDQRNRKSQAEFSCIHCAHQGHPDHFGALEIAQRAALVSRPNCPERHVPGKDGVVLQGKATPL